MLTIESDGSENVLFLEMPVFSIIEYGTGELFSKKSSEELVSEVSDESTRDSSDSDGFVSIKDLTVSSKSPGELGQRLTSTKAESLPDAGTVALSTEPWNWVPGPTWLASSGTAWGAGGGLPSIAWFGLLVWVVDIFVKFLDTSFSFENTEIDDGNGNGTSAARVEG